MKVISQEMFKIFLFDMPLKITNLKLQIVLLWVKNCITTDDPKSEILQYSKYISR